MLRNQILGFRRAGMEEGEIAATLDIEPEVVRAALGAIGGSSVIRQQIREAEPEDEEVSAAESGEMLGILKTIARSEDSGVFAQMSAAKYVHGVRAGYHKRHLDLNVSSGGLLNKINDAYADAAAKAFLALKRPAPEINVTASAEKPAAPNPGP
ncbi:MAG: hypothetical protein EBR82_41610 [Caulobacteraceae bacterium]|nr:hypothetical protein [Caulobacteraceae bacterium]